MAEKPGYLLPEGDAYTDQLACALVFYPDKEEYRRALLGSLVYLSTWVAWERDSEKRGKDAARAWKNAVEETMECWIMTCFEDLIADVATIRMIMETRKDCCDDNVTYFPTEFPTTEIVPGVGDAPDLYGETEIADWDEWNQHVCFNAHAYVDYLIDSAGNLYDAVQLSSIWLGLIAAILGLLAFSGIGLPIAYGLAAAVVAGLALGATASTFLNTATDFETAREDIVCDIMLGMSLPDAVEAALSSGTDWDLFYQFVDYESAVAILYEGGYGAEFLPSETRDDCTCEAFQNYIFTFPTDLDGWVSGALNITWDAGEYITLVPDSTGPWRDCHTWVWTALATRFSFSLPIFYDQLRFRFYFHPGSGSMGTWEFYFIVYGKDDETRTSPMYNTGGYADSEWHEIIWNMASICESGTTNKHIKIRVRRTQPASAGQRLWLDDVGLYSK